MTEEQWLRSTDPHQMSNFLQERGLLSERKARLFAVACCRRVWEWMIDERGRRAVEVCELHADGCVGQKKLKEARRTAFTASKSPSPPQPKEGYSEAYICACTVALHACMDAKKNEPSLLCIATAGCACSVVFRTVGDAAGFAEYQVHCELLRDIVLNPFRPPLPLPPVLLTWNDRTIPRLAATIYEERSLPEGRLDVA